MFHFFLNLSFLSLPSPLTIFPSSLSLFFFLFSYLCFPLFLFILIHHFSSSSYYYSLPYLFLHILFHNAIYFFNNCSMYFIIYIYFFKYPIGSFCLRPHSYMIFGRFLARIFLQVSCFMNLSIWLFSFFCVFILFHFILFHFILFIFFALCHGGPILLLRNYSIGFLRKCHFKKISEFTVFASTGLNRVTHWGIKG